MIESRQPIANLGDYLQRGAANETGLPGRSSKRYLKTMIKPAYALHASARQSSLET
jgi:hypothetical protein